MCQRILKKIVCWGHGALEARRELLETLFGIIQGPDWDALTNGEGTSVSDKVVSGSAHSTNLY